MGRPLGIGAGTPLGNTNPLYLQACSKHLPGPTWSTKSQPGGARQAAYPHVGVTQRVPGTSDGLLCDPGVPIGLDLQHSHLEGRPRSGREESTGEMQAELAGRPQGHRAATSSAHIPKEKMSTAVPSATSERGRASQVGCGARGVCGAQPGLLDSGLTTVLWREEVKVPWFLALHVDRASEIIRERCGERRG